MSLMMTSLLVLALQVAMAGGPVAPAASPCRGAAPPVGVMFRGPVLHVVDGQRLCVALGPDPSEWAEVRLAGLGPDGSRQVLMAAAFAKDVDCTVLAPAEDAPYAACSFAGRDLAALTRDVEVRKQAAAWR